MSSTIAIVPRAVATDANNQTEQQIVKAIVGLRDTSLEVNKMEFAKLFKQLQKHYAKGSKNAQFGKRVEELGFARRTVYRWMDEYDAQVGHKPKKDSVPFGTESPQPTQNEEVAEKSHGSSKWFTDNAVEAVDPSSSLAPEPASPVKVLPFDTAEKRKKFIFQHAVLALQEANVYTDSPREEWDEVDQQVRQWLASFAVDNAVPASDINQLQQREQEN